MTGGAVLQVGGSKTGDRGLAVVAAVLLLVGVTAVGSLRSISGDQVLSPEATAEVEAAIAGFLDGMNQARVDLSGGDLPRSVDGGFEIGSDQVRSAVEQRLAFEDGLSDMPIDTAYVDHVTTFEVHTAAEHGSGDVSIEGTERRSFTIADGGRAFPSSSVIPHRFVVRIDDGVVVLLDWDETGDASQ